MNTGFFLVQIERLQSSSVGNPPYFGIDRSPWSCVDEKFYGGKLPSDLVDLRKNSFENNVGALSFGMLVSEHEVVRLAKACGDAEAKDSQILAVESLGPITKTVTANDDDFCGLGFDAYADGFGSLLYLGIVQRPDLFGRFLAKLNGYGLFTTLSDIQQYVAEYLCIAAPANLEVIEDSAQVWIYRIVGIHDLTAD